MADCFDMIKKWNSLSSFVNVVVSIILESTALYIDVHRFMAFRGIVGKRRPIPKTENFTENVDIEAIEVKSQDQDMNERCTCSVILL